MSGKRAGGSQGCDAGPLPCGFSALQAGRLNFFRLWLIHPAPRTRPRPAPPTKAPLKKPAC
ncbi:MAG: hypothetical protein ABF673_08670, partial [Acetobacter persici]